MKPQLINYYPTSWAAVAKLPKIRRPDTDCVFITRTTKFDQWRLLEAYRVETPWGPVGAYRGFLYNQATVVKNLLDAVACTCHDSLYIHGINLDGVVLTRKQIDMMYRWLNERSWWWANRHLAAVRYYGVRVFGWWQYNATKPVPPKGQWMYAYLPFNDGERKVK